MSEDANDSIIKIFFSSTGTLPAAYAFAQKSMSKMPQIDLHLNRSLDDIRFEIESNSKCIVVMALSDREEISIFINFLQTIRKRTKAKQVVAIAILKINSEKIEEMLQKIGCSEILKFDIAPKAFVHKMNRHLKSLEQVQSSDEDISFLERASTSELEPEESVKSAKSIETPNPSGLVMINALNSPHDFWLFARSSHAKRINEQWFIEMIGPSPAAGRWVDRKISFRGLSTWEWTPTEAFDSFITSPAQWIFVGNEPVYSWTMNRWGFTSSQPELSLYQDTARFASRFRIGNRQQLEMAKNSKYAESLRSKIRETYDQAYRFAQKGVKHNNLEGNLHENDLPWSDLTDSKDLGALEWGTLSQIEEEKRASHKNSSLNSNARNFIPELGIDSMRPCGISGLLGQSEIEIIGYSPDRFLLIGAPLGQVRVGESVIIEIKAKRLGKKNDYKIDGKVIKIFQIDQAKSIAKLQLNQDSAQFLESIEKLVDERQSELSSFFSQAKGLPEDPSLSSAEDEKAAQSYLEGNQILILDSVSSARVSLASSLVKLGAKRNQMSLVGSITEAREVMSKKLHKVIFSDYMIGNCSGFDFIQEQKARFKQNQITDAVCILITANASQSTAARAAEEDVDQFVIKPYRFNHIKKVLIESIRTKLNPPMYLKLIEQGKSYLQKNIYDEAESAFQQAVSVDVSPTLAFYYLAQSQEAKQKWLEAEKSYLRGLELNHIHYKCLSGLHELLWSQKRYSESYGAIKKLVTYFPSNSKRLSNALRAAIITESFKDTEWFHKIYLHIDDRTEELTRYMCSALVVTGKYFLQQNLQEKALNLFDSAAVSAAGQSRFLLYIVENLVNAGLHKEGARFLKRLHAIDHTHPDCRAAKFLISSLTDPLPDAIHLGRKAIADGVAIPSVYEKLILLSIKGGYVDAAEELSHEARKRWPEKSSDFTLVKMKAT